MSKRRVTLMGVRPVHPGRGEPSFVELSVCLEYLADMPIESVVLTSDQALSLARQAIDAVITVDRSLVRQATKP